MRTGVLATVAAAFALLPAAASAADLYTNPTVEPQGKAAGTATRSRS